MLLSMFCGVDFWPHVFQLEIASCYWACFAQIFSSSTFLKLMSHPATEHVFRSWVLTAEFSNRNCIVLVSMLCVIDFLALDFSTGNCIMLLSMFSEFFSAHSIPNCCRIMPLSIFCGFDFWPLIFATRNFIVLLSMLCVIDFSAPVFTNGNCVKLLSKLCIIFPCFSFPIRKLNNGTEPKYVLPKFSPATPFPNWCRIIPLSMFCAIFPCSSLPNRKLHQQLSKIYLIFFASSFPKLMSHHATEHFLRSWVVTADFSTKNCIVLMSMFCAIFFLLLFSY